MYFVVAAYAQAKFSENADLVSDTFEEFMSIRELELLFVEFTTSVNS